MAIESIEDQLRRDEGWRSYPYRDSVGKITIGYGRNLTDIGITDSEGSVMLANDISGATRMLSSVFPWTDALDDVRKGAMVNMVFNMGISGIGQFKQFLAAMQAGNWEEASAQMLDSQWANQVGARAQRLALQIRQGVWQ